MLDFSRCRYPPFAHQREDVAAMLAHPYFFIASEPRTGKTKIVVDAAQFMFEAGTIDRVVVIAPAPVRDVWADRTLGEIAKHSFADLPATVTEFHARVRTWQHGGVAARKLDWYVSNYEFLRSKSRLVQLLPVCTPKTLLVLDESAFVKTYDAAQTEACLQLRKECGRVVLLNGTPIFHSPLDLFSQGNILHPSILECKYITHFKARYCIQEPVLGFGGKVVKTPRGRAVMRVAGWTNLEDLQRRFAPCTVRRLQKECLDLLPLKLDPVALTATLTLESWRAYKAMRDHLVVWLQSGDVAVSSTAAIKAMRLSQITSGFLAGIEDANVGDEPIEDGLIEGIDWSRGESFSVEMTPGVTHDIDGFPWVGPPIGEEIAKDVSEMISKLEEDKRKNPLKFSSIQEVGREKLDVLLWFLGKRLAEDPNVKVVAWGRFRAEVFRAVDEVAKMYPQFEVASIHGGQKRADRLRALALLKPETAPKGPVFVAGIEGTGSFGLDFTASHTCITMSSGYSPGRSAQTLDRVYGPGQVAPVAYYDVVAVGPKGQRTIDHVILEARRAGQDIADLTADAWVKKLTEE